MRCSRSARRGALWVLGTLCLSVAVRLAAWTVALPHSSDGLDTHEGGEEGRVALCDPHGQCGEWGIGLLSTEALKAHGLWHSVHTVRVPPRRAVFLYASEDERVAPLAAYATGTWVCPPTVAALVTHARVTGTVRSNCT
jgi:hypothetical protein